MDVIVTATSGAGKKILDITKVKPGCVITDVARPLDLSPEDVAKRPDVLVIESGEIELPGNPEMKSIGLPHKVAYACLAETIVLALEARFENFTLGRNIEWEKVREIYKLGLKHGMKLAAISGVNGVFTEEDFERVRVLAASEEAPQPMTILNPVIWIEGEAYLLMAHLLAAIPASTLKKKISSATTQRDEIIASLDVLFTGI
jgi:hypothetical protein